MGGRTLTASDQPSKTAKIEVRVTDELKAAVLAKAAAKGTTLSERITSWLSQWVEQ